MRSKWIAAAVLCGAAALGGGCAHEPVAKATAPRAAATGGGTYGKDRIMREAEAFFGKGARGLADVVNRVFADNGPPDAYIKGEEGGGALGVGLRYGRGTLFYKDGTSTAVFWRGPSLGIDFGGNASKTFVLIYHLPDVESVFQRFGGVEGSLYYVGGVGVTYNRSDDILLAPVRFGVGWRQGINVGYLHLSPDRSWIPF